MRQRPLGRTGLLVSELALGTWGLSGDGYGPVPEREQDVVIERAAALGINLFETADSYAAGAMERRLGRLLPESSGALIATKIGTDLGASYPRKRFDRAFLEQSLSASRERLQRQRLDLVLLHNPSVEAVRRGEATAVLKEQVEQGALRAWGISAGSREVAQAAIEVGAPVVSITCNAFAPGPLEAVAALPAAKEIGILAHSVLAYGLLSGLWTRDREFFEGDHRADRWSRDVLQKRLQQLDALRPAVTPEVPSLRAVALRYVLSRERIASLLLGPRGALQLDQLVRDAGREPPYLPDHHLTALEARLRDVGVLP